MNSLLNHVYTLQEIANVLNLSLDDIAIINYYSKKKQLYEILSKVPKLKKFEPFLKLIKVQGKNLFIIPAIIFDKYLEIGILPDTGIDVKEPDINKKEYWEYNSSYIYEFNTKDNWEFALKYFRDKDYRIESEDIWNIFLAGCARMNYYQENNIDISQRIKYAIMEYMLRRPQYFNTDDFIDNPELRKK